MPGANASPAGNAAADVDIEPTHQGLAGDLDLELRIDAFLLHKAAAVGALRGQRHIMNLLGRLLGHGSVGLGPVVGSTLMPRLLGLVLGRSLGERRSLAFGGAGGFVQELLQLANAGLQLLHAGFQLGDLAILPGDDLQELFVRLPGHLGRSCISSARDAS